MSRRIRVRIERLVVDAGSGVDRHALADALRRQLLTIRADQALTEQLTTLRERHPVRILQAAEQ